MGVQVPEILKDGLIAGLATAMGAAVSSLARAWRKPSAPDEMIDAATKAAKAVIEELRLEVGRVSARVAAVEAENFACQGENRQLWSHIGGLERILRDHGIPIPTRDLPGSLLVIEGDHRTVLKPGPRPKKD